MINLYLNYIGEVRIIFYLMKKCHETMLPTHLVEEICLYIPSLVFFLSVCEAIIDICVRMNVHTAPPVPVWFFGNCHGSSHEDQLLAILPLCCLSNII